MMEGQEEQRGKSLQKVASMANTVQRGRRLPAICFEDSDVEFIQGHASLTVLTM